MKSARSPKARAVGREILRCNHCFERSTTANGCWHHEDILGGYEQGRILVLTINAQRPFDPEWEHERYRPPPPRRKAKRRQSPGGALNVGLQTYRTIRDAGAQKKMTFADASLRIFAGESAGPFANWVANHPGHKQWLPMVCELLLGADTPGTRRELAAHFVFLDIYKHATANQAHLDLLRKDHPLDDCPGRWLGRQVELLQPALVLLCGKRVIAKAKANDLWEGGGEELRAMEGVGAVHGLQWCLKIGGIEVEARTAYALAGTAEHYWRTKSKQMGTRAIRDAIRQTIRTRTKAE